MPPISNVLKQSWLLFQNTLTYCIPLNFLLGIFSLTPIFFIQELQNPPTPEIFQKGLQIFAPYLPFYISGLVILNAAIFYRLGYLMQNQLLPLGETYLFVFKRLFPLLGATILFGFAVGIGFMALFVPGLIFATYLMFYQPLVLFANASMFEAIEKSYLLVKGKMGYAFIVGAVAISMIPFWSIFLQFVLEMINVELPFELTIIFEILLNTLLASFFHCTILVLYGIFISTAQIKITDSFVA
jgi:hypothetical protein